MKSSVLLLTVMTVFIMHEAISQEKEPCGTVTTREYIAKWKNPNSIQNKRLDFLKRLSLEQVFQIEKLEYKNGKFQVTGSTVLQDKSIVAGDRFLVNRIIPIVAHIVRRTNGTGGLAVADLNNAVANANVVYNKFHFILEVCEVRFIDDTNIFNTNFNYTDDRNGTANASYTVLNVIMRNAANRINIYCVPNSNTSWAPFPNDDNRRQHVLLNNGQATNGSTLGHELGHWFDVMHTHDTTGGAELVDGSNCETAGDDVCDTPADPNLSGLVNTSCVYTGTGTDANGDTYNPDTRNMMSYSLPSCRNKFTDGQIYRMQSAFWGMETDRGYVFNTCAVAVRTVNNFGYNAGGWRVEKNPRLLGDVNGDGRKDIVGFGNERVFVSLGRANGTFGDPIRTVANYGYNAGGWRVEKNPRFLGDVNGDNRDDIIGFGNDRVYVSLGKADGTFTDAIRTVENFGYNASAGGWEVGKNPRLIGDVNGDNRDDIVGFGNERVFVSLGRANGTFGDPIRTVANYGYNAGGWEVEKNPRMLGDVNGDNRVDIIGFGNERVFVSLGNGDGTFTDPIRTVENFGYNAGGWRNNKNPRMIGDVNGDGRADIVGFGNDNVWTAHGKTDGTFTDAFRNIENYCYGSGGWRVDQHPRMVGDINGDGRDDIVGCGTFFVFVSLAESNGRFRNMTAALDNLSYDDGWRVDRHPRILGDVNGDGKVDLVGFGNLHVYVVSGDSID